MGAEFSFGTVLMVAFIITSVCYLYIIFSTYMYDSRTKARRDYMFTGVTLFFFSFFYGFMTLAEIQFSLRILWAIGFFGGSMFFPLWMIFLTNLITIKLKYIKNLLRAVLLMSASISLLCILFGDVSFRSTEFGSQFSYPGNILFITYFVYNMILSAVLLFVHVKWYLQSELKRHRRQVLIFIIISTISLPIVLITDFIIPIFTNYTFIPLGAIVILPPSFFVYFSLRKYKLFGITVSNVSQYTFTSVKMPIYVLDNNNIIVIENNAAIECLGESAVGKSISNYFFADGATPDESFFKEEFASRSVYLDAGSGMRICDMSLTIEKDDNNDAICKIVVFTDLTTIKEMEKNTVKALNEALEANKVKSDFLAKMSHEIRTPMNAIIGMTDLVLREKISKPVREHTMIIKQAGDNLLSIINDLLDFSTIETGKIQILAEFYSLSSLINDVVNIIKVRLSSSEVKFALNINKDIPNILVGDVARIRQVLINVLGNAVKHTERGQITLTVDHESLYDETLDLIIIIEDTGSGIKQDDIKKLFTEYYQVRTSTDGVGLGLAITQGLLAAMNGAITVKSEYGKGSKFTIKIPQKIGDSGQQAVFMNSQYDDYAAGIYKEINTFIAPDARILVVDDISTNLKVVSGILAPYNMKIDLCLSGKDAIDAVKSCRYDIVLMDYRMPEMDGVEATELIRALDGNDPYYSTLPVIALTADAVSGRREMFLESGFNDFISKPISKEELNTALEKWIPHHKKRVLEAVSNETDNINDPADKPVTINGLNVEKGIKLSGGKTAHYYETLVSFHADASERLALIRNYYIARELDLYITVVHAIKSATANIGADKLSLLAAGLENAGLCEDWDHIVNNNDSFLEALEDLLRNIKAVLMSRDKDSENNKDGEDLNYSEDINNELIALKKALEDIDIVATNKAVDSLIGLARSEDEKNSIRDISHHILMFEYDKAIKLIDEF